MYNGLVGVQNGKAEDLLKARFENVNTSCCFQSIQHILSKMEFPTLSIGPAHFCFKSCWVVFFILMKILIENSAKTENKSEATSISPIQNFDAEFRC